MLVGNQRAEPEIVGEFRTSRRAVHRLVRKLERENAGADP